MTDKLFRQGELGLKNPNEYKCKHCGAMSEDLLYAEEITVFYNGIRVEDNHVYISDPGSDYSCPTNVRLFCSACDTYIYGEQAGEEGTADPTIEVHHE